MFFCYIRNFPFYYQKFLLCRKYMKAFTLFPIFSLFCKKGTETEIVVANGVSRHCGAMVFPKPIFLNMKERYLPIPNNKKYQAGNISTVLPSFLTVSDSFQVTI